MGSSFWEEEDEASSVGVGEGGGLSSEDDDDMTLLRTTEEASQTRSGVNQWIQEEDGAPSSSMQAGRRLDL